MPPDDLDLLPDGVVLADGDGRVRRVSVVAARMLGTEPDAAVGRPLADVLTLLDQRGCAWSEVNRPFAGLRTRTAVPEQSWLLPDGGEVLVTARLHRAERGGPVTAAAVSLRSARGRERLDRERSDLVATVAHELRSPLTGVKGFVTALLNRWDKLQDEQKKLMLTTVASDADRLSRLIVELLDVARIDTGRLQLSPRPTDPAVIAERVVASVAAATSRAVVLESVPASDGSLPRLHADPDKLTQVLTNLVENGVRHGEGTVLVRLSVPDPGHVLLEVSDEGEGIAPEMRARVFTKFWTSGVRGGSGLGLYIVHGLVRAHGGTVTLGTAPGGGALVSITWPVEQTY
ncbi:HAMP domain-containing sensor histidine kinase [Nocardioides sp. GY 10127]|uniref:sensor histidine kinase n=1 Tax=Nocardioides sp. GY 10127 TaxID=2569762 RepID=UPI0010A7976E|nr:HAMP domain-containing sensor histidine kinase [Nocardioides sp. GY 10127]TIC78702.1 HAMP domain-containing histidine kinase [Nocardioides sp. GY 10127]TIC81050.1 HAMP domain-containing histidine kinase [Nocardioides sp. GY 10127]